MDAVPCRLQPGTEESAGRALAVGPGNMEHRRQILVRAAERVEQGIDPIEPQLVVVDMLGRLPRDQRREPRIVGPHDFLHAAAFLPLARDGAR